MVKLRVWLGVVVLGGCATTGVVTGQTAATLNAGQSETAATSSYAGKYRLVASFNDETGNDGKLTYTQTTRTITPGVSLLGWSYSEDDGKTWTYGGKVVPPKGWSVLWGDPAMTTSDKSYAVVFITNLAMPEGKFPASGSISGYVTYGAKGSYIGGACIARSTDGGITFANYQCVADLSPDAGDPDAVKGHFYDGGSMASTNDGAVYAAFVDVTKSQIDVWRAPDHNGTFTPIGDPFPGLVAVNHPRLRAAVADDSLYAATVVQSGYDTGYIYINRYKNGQWGAPVPASDLMVVYPSVDLGASVAGSPLTIRTGPQFSYDVGAASEGGNDAIRFLYTRRDSTTSRLYLDSSVCPTNLNKCFHGGWKVGPSKAGETPLDVFNPTVAAWPGFIGLPPAWIGSFTERYGVSDTKMSISRMYLNYVNGSPLSFPVNIVKDIAVCSDTRGYWGDYDAIIHAGFDGSVARFARFHTSDLGNGCTRRWTYVGDHQHVQAAVEP